MDKYVDKMGVGGGEIKKDFWVWDLDNWMVVVVTHQYKKFEKKYI